MSTVNKSYQKTDEVVKLRNGMEMILREGVKRGNLGDTKYLKTALKRISTYDNYKVNLNLTKDIAINGKRYRAGSKVTNVMEGDKVIFAIYKDERDRLTKLHVNPFDLMYERDLKDTFQAEIKAMMMESEWAFQYDDLLKQVNRMKATRQI